MSFSLLSSLLSIPTPAQLPDLSVTPLPDPPLVQRLLFEQPLPALVLLIALAVVAVAVGNQRARLKTGLIVAAAALLAAAAVFVTARTIETEREKLTEASIELAEAVGRADADAAAPLIAETYRYTGYPANADWDRENLLKAITTRVPGAGVTNVVVLEVQAHVDSDRVARTQVRVRPEADGRVLDLPSWWRLDWRRDSAEGEWRCGGVEPIAATWLR